jgi:large subunit ribosomal protein L15
VTLEDILSVPSGRRPHRRLGRGSASGSGKTCGRGQKGQGARSGGPARGHLFEGGQFPLWKRLPRRGFNNLVHAHRYQTLSLTRVLARIPADVIDLDALIGAGLVEAGEVVKLVGGVAMDRAVTIRVHRVTASVRQAVEAAGGKVEALHE